MDKRQDATQSVAHSLSAPAAAVSPRAALWFDNRRWYHPAVFVGALLLGGSTHVGVLSGILFVLAFALLRCWAARHIGGAARVHRRKASKPRHLVTDGPFAYVRNPLYVANSLGITGACLLVGPPWFAVLAGFGSLLWYVGVTRFEVPTLRALYPDEYPDYLARTPAFVPRLRGAARNASTSEVPPRPWGRVIARERGALGFTALLVGVALWRLSELTG